MKNPRRKPPIVVQVPETHLVAMLIGIYSPDAVAEQLQVPPATVKRALQNYKRKCARKAKPTPTLH